MVKKKESGVLILVGLIVAGSAHFLIEFGDITHKYIFIALGLGVVLAGLLSLKKK